MKDIDKGQERHCISSRLRAALLEDFKREENPDILQIDRNQRFKVLTYNIVANRSVLRNNRVNHFGSNEEDRSKSGELDLIL